MELKEKVEAVLNDVYHGLHHLPNKLKDRGYCFELNHYGDLATFDFNELTILVLAAHKYCVRVSINPSGRGLVKLLFHDRKREGGFTERHPTIEDAIKIYRKHD